MLDIWILNVGHGDSIVLEYRNAGAKAFAVIDSNWSGEGEPAAVKKLRELGAKSLSFVALTHPHADHYTGLSVILDQYKGKIANFFSFPFRPFADNRIRKLAEAYARVFKTTDSAEVKRRMHEFIVILKSAKEQFGEQRWLEMDGVYNDLMPEGFAGADIISILPPARAKGYYLEMIEKGDLNLASGQLNENELSAAFLIKVAGVEIILGGDGTRANWTHLFRQWSRKPLKLRALAAKLPHHGSREDCAPDVLRNIFSSTGSEIACISANGRTHPHLEVLRDLEASKIAPYCTNLSVDCGAKFREVISGPELSPRLLRFLSTIQEPSQYDKKPCQGDIHLSILATGDIKIYPEFDNACPYRHNFISDVRGGRR